MVPLVRNSCSARAVLDVTLGGRVAPASSSRSIFSSSFIALASSMSVRTLFNSAKSKPFTKCVRSTSPPKYLLSSMDLFRVNSASFVAPSSPPPPPPPSLSNTPRAISTSRASDPTTSSSSRSRRSLARSLYASVPTAGRFFGGRPDAFFLLVVDFPDASLPAARAFICVSRSASMRRKSSFVASGPRSSSGPGGAGFEYDMGSGTEG